MGVLKSWGITPSEPTARRGAIGLDLGILIVAVGCVSLISRSWIVSAAIIAVGLAVFAVSAVKRRKRTGRGSRHVV